jgi:hypothetical protein
MILGHAAEGDLPLIALWAPMLDGEDSPTRQLAAITAIATKRASRPRSIRAVNVRCLGETLFGVLTIGFSDHGSYRGRGACQVVDSPN